MYFQYIWVENTAGTHTHTRSLALHRKTQREKQRLACHRSYAIGFICATYLSPFGFHLCCHCCFCFPSSQFGRRFGSKTLLVCVFKCFVSLPFMFGCTEFFELLLHMFFFFHPISLSYTTSTTMTMMMTTTSPKSVEHFVLIWWNCATYTHTYAH